MVILVKLCIALCGHTSVPHDNVHAVRNVDLHFPSGKWTFVDPQAVVEAICNASRIRAAHLALSGERVQDFVLRMGTEALLKIN